MLPENDHQDGHLRDGDDQGHEEEQHHEGHYHLALRVTSPLSRDRYHRHLLELVVVVILGRVLGQSVGAAVERVGPGEGVGGVVLATEDARTVGEVFSTRGAT